MDIVASMVAGHKWSAYKNKPLHPVWRWGRALFESLSVTWDRQDQLLFRGGMQAVVPRACIPEILEMVDAVHNGADRACLLAQRSYYWDGLKADVRKHCKECVTCKVMSTKPKQEALLLTDPPPSIGHTQAMDFASVGLRGPKKKLLVLVDLLSGYSEVFRFLLPPTSATIISKLTDFWNSTGWPVVFCSDGEANLDTAEFSQFLSDNNITRCKSSAAYPQSNGAAEKAVQSFKRLYEKKEQEGTPWVEVWALWRDTPQESGQLLLARLWFGCPVRHPRWFSPAMPSNPDTFEEAKENYCKLQEGYRCRDDPGNLFKHPAVKWVLRPGSRVLMADRHGSKVKDIPAVVLTVSPSDRSCRVQRDTDNHMFLLNRSKLVRDPAFADNDVNDGGAMRGTPGGEVISPRGAMRRAGSPVDSPVPVARRRLRFMGLQQIPDTGDEVAEADAVVFAQPPDSDPVPNPYWYWIP